MSKTTTTVIVRRTKGGWRASVVFHIHGLLDDRDEKRSVIGVWPTQRDARMAGFTYIALQECPDRLCNLRDIDLARKERAKLPSPLPLSEQEGKCSLPSAGRDAGEAKG